VVVQSQDCEKWFCNPKIVSIQSWGIQYYLNRSELFLCQYLLRWSAGRASMFSKSLFAIVFQTLPDVRLLLSTFVTRFRGRKVGGNEGKWDERSVEWGRQECNHATLTTRKHTCILGARYTSTPGLSPRPFQNRWLVFIQIFSKSLIPRQGEWRVEERRWRTEEGRSDNTNFKSHIFNWTVVGFHTDSWMHSHLAGPVTPVQWCWHHWSVWGIHNNEHTAMIHLETYKNKQANTDQQSP